MDRARYIEIRKQLDLTIRPHMLALHYLQDAVLIGLSLSLIYFYAGTWQHLLAIPLLSTLMFRNFSLMHDAVHTAVSKNKKLNNVVGVIAGGLCILPYEQWKAVHLEHHYWSGNIEKDPVMGLVRTFPKWPKAMKAIIGFGWRAWVPVLAVFQYGIFWWHSTIHFLKKPTSMKHLASIFFPALFWSACLLALPTGAGLSLVLPAVIAYLLAVEVVNFPHHLGLPQFTEDTKIPVWNQYQIARSCIYPTWFAKMVVLNFNYHIEHHMYPDAPWYSLDRIHKLIKQELASEYNTDPQFAWILENRPKDLQSLLIVEKSVSLDQKTA